MAIVDAVIGATIGDRRKKIATAGVGNLFINIWDFRLIINLNSIEISILLQNRLLLIDL